MKVDVVVVGAGTAGAAVAAFCAERGLRTACLERRPLEEAGGRWVNDIPEKLFDEAGVARPAGDELLDAGHDAHLIAGRGPRGMRLRRPAVLTVDMRRLVARLHARALEAGAELRGAVAVGAFDGRVLDTDAGRWEARFFVDAGGLSGPRLLGQPLPARCDLCVAGSWVHRVRDAGALRGFFESVGASPQECVNFLGIAGGFSTLTLRSFGDVLYVMAGSVPADGQPPGPEVARAFVESHPWIGARLWGGSRAIPLGRTHARLAAGNVALVGDAASQVFPAHASGVGAGLVAARLLAETLAAGAEPHRYAVRWQRGRGALHAVYEQFRRFSRTLTAADEERLFASGLAAEAISLAAVEQRWPPPDLAAAVAAARGALREPSLVARLARWLPRMAAVRAHHALYPEDPARLPAWTRIAERLAGPLAR